MYVWFLTNDVGFGGRGWSPPVVSFRSFPPASKLHSLRPWTGWLPGGDREGLGARFLDLGLRKRQVMCAVRSRGREEGRGDKQACVSVGGKEEVEEEEVLESWGDV